MAYYRDQVWPIRPYSAARGPWGRLFLNIGPQSSVGKAARFISPHKECKDTDIDIHIDTNTHTDIDIDMGLNMGYRKHAGIDLDLMLGLGICIGIDRDEVTAKTVV